MSDNFYLDKLGIKMEEFNPNPKHTDLKNYRNINDCMFRSLCKLLNKDWDTVFKEMTELVFQEKLMQNSTNLIRAYLEPIGFKRYDFPFERKTTVVEFMYNHKKGKYLVGTAKYIVCYIDGVIYDVVDTKHDLNYFLLDYVKHVFTNEEEIQEEKYE